MCETMVVNDKSYSVIWLLGKGKEQTDFVWISWLFFVITACFYSRSIQGLICQSPVKWDSILQI